jgi:hypothetical protein
MSATLCLVALAAVFLPADVDPPRARIDFPLPSALTDAETIRVRGSASDPDGVAAVRVNGVPASTADGFATWWAEVPLVVGENELVVETVDALGQIDREAASTVVRRDGVIVADPESVTHDSSGRRMWISDFEPVPGTYSNFGMRVLAVDTVSKQASVVSSRAIGKGPLPDSAKVRFDPHSGGVLCIDRDLDALLHIDLANGDRTVISGAGVGIGTPFTDPVDVAVDTQSPRAWVVQIGGFQQQGAVLEVNLLTGQRKLISAPNLGSGPWPTAPVGIAVAPGNQRALVQFTEDFWNPDGMPLIAVDLKKGHRAWISDGPAPPLRPWKTPKSLVVPTGSLAFVGDAWFLQGGVFGVDLASGAARKVSDAEHAAGPLTEVADLAWNPSTSRLTTLDSYRDSILAMDPSDGSFELLYRNELGDGPVLSKYIYGVAVDPREPQSAIILDVQYDNVVEVNLFDGRRKLVSGPGKGFGPLWANAWHMAADMTSTPPRAFVMELGLNRIYSVDLETGDREIVSSPDIGVGEPLVSPYRVEYDPISDTLFVLDSVEFFDPYRIMKVDPRTGDRTVLSDARHGIGPPLMFSFGMAIDSDGRRLWAVSHGALLEVDLATGNRRLFSGHGVGNGPDLTLGAPLVWDPHARRIVLWCAGGLWGQVAAVDGHTGERSVLSTFTEAAGPGRPYPVDMALMQPSPVGVPLLVLPDLGLGAIQVVDLLQDPAQNLNPGWRTIVSR